MTRTIRGGESVFFRTRHNTNCASIRSTSVGKFALWTEEKGAVFRLLLWALLALFCSCTGYISINLVLIAYGAKPMQNIYLKSPQYSYFDLFKILRGCLYFYLSAKCESWFEYVFHLNIWKILYCNALQPGSTPLHDVTNTSNRSYNIYLVSTIIYTPYFQTLYFTEQTIIVICYRESLQFFPLLYVCVCRWVNRSLNRVSSLFRPLRRLVALSMWQSPDSSPEKHQNTSKLCLFLQSFS